MFDWTLSDEWFLYDVGGVISGNNVVESDDAAIVRALNM